MARDLTPDGRLILAVFAESDGPVDWNDAVERLASQPETLFGGARDQQQFYRTQLARRNYLTAEVMLLLRDGLLAEVEDGAVDVTVITEAGREALLASAQHAEQGAQRALTQARKSAAAILADMHDGKARR